MNKYFKKIKMSKTFVKWFLSICLVLIICMNLKIYVTKGEINIASLVAVLALLPISLKSLEYKISKNNESDEDNISQFSGCLFHLGFNVTNPL